MRFKLARLFTIQETTVPVEIPHMWEWYIREHSSIVYTEFANHTRFRRHSMTRHNMRTIESMIMHVMFFVYSFDQDLNITHVYCLTFLFVHIYAPRGCCSIVCLHFQFMQVKQVDCKMTTKNLNNYKQKTFLDISDNCAHKSIKPRRRGYKSEASAKWKKVKGKPDKINGLILKTKADLKEGLDNI